MGIELSVAVVVDVAEAFAASSLVLAVVNVVVVVAVAMISCYFLCCVLDFDVLSRAHKLKTQPW